MDYLGTGFSNIRLPNDRNSYIYTYSSNLNTFPEEVFIHEFLHSLERTMNEYGYDIPALHDNVLYGYENDRLTGLKDWYEDYMTCNIDADGKKIGLDKIVYTLKPPNQSDFKYSLELPFDKEPKNIIEEIRNIFKSAFNITKLIKSEVEQ